MNDQVREARKVNDISGELYADAYLTNFSLAFRQEEEVFVAPSCATPIGVLQESGKYATYPRGYFLRDEAKVRPLGGRPEQVSYKVEPATYAVEEWALEHTIDDRQRTNAAGGPYDLDEAGVALLEGKMLIREDRTWATQFFTTGVWTFDIDLTLDFDPFNDAASNPIQAIDYYALQMAKATGKRPNTIVFGAAVTDALRINSDITDRVKYTQRGIADEALLASLFRVRTVKTAMSVYNTAAEGAADDFEFIIDENSMWMGYIEPQPRMNAATAIARFGWTGLYPGANQAGGVILRGRDGRASSDWIQSRNAYAYKQVSPDLGAFFTNAVVPNSQ
jgi:hypothetical protein